MPHSAVLPGQQHTPNASKAMPSTRATGITMPVNSAPNRSNPTSDGTIRSAIPVATSATAATVSTFFIELLFLIVATRSGIDENSLPLHGLLLRFEFEGQLVDLTCELKWRNVAVFQHRDTSARVLADVEHFVFRERNPDNVFHGILGHFRERDE